MLDVLANDGAAGCPPELKGVWKRCRDEQLIFFPLHNYKIICSGLSNVVLSYNTVQQQGCSKCFTL